MARERACRKGHSFCAIKFRMPHLNDGEDATGVEEPSSKGLVGSCKDAEGHVVSSVWSGLAHLRA